MLTLPNPPHPVPHRGRAALLVALLWHPLPFHYAFCFLLYVIVGATDYLDGYLARAQGRCRSSASSSIRSPTRSWWPPADR